MTSFAKTRLTRISLAQALLPAIALATLATGGLAPARANPPENNSSFVADVTLSHVGIYYNVTLENVGGNHVSQVEFEPTGDVMYVPLDGHVKCAQDNDIDYSNAALYLGVVERSGNHIVPSNILYQGPYAPTATVWQGALSQWVSEVGNGYEPGFPIPLADLYNGHPVLRFRPAEEFEAAMDQFVANGGSKLEFLQSERLIVAERLFSLAGFCTDGGATGGGYVTELIPLIIRWPGDPSLTDALQPLNAQGNLTAPFQVTAAGVTPQVPQYVGECPEALAFDLAITANGPGEVSYRLVDKLGNKGPLNIMTFNAAGEQTQVFTRTVEYEGAGDAGGTLTVGPGGGGGFPGGVAGAIATEQSSFENDSWRVEIVEPASFMSEEAFYTWKCKPKVNFTGPGQVRGRGPNEAPVGTLRAAPQAGGSAPTTAPGGLQAEPVAPRRFRLRP